MKKSIILLSIVLISCSKDYKCDCKTTNLSVSPPASYTDQYTVHAKSMTEANSECNKLERKSNSYEVACELR